ncbi:MAG TPA: hypothetical protein PLJ21_03555, partial [Pseudobdellovibrionaceae bacterium]|nr:hypothetical protein [Pseudobdellovibrionaceae bacterium]
MKQILIISLLVSVFQANAKAGVEWGNGENGFSANYKALELPFSEPVIQKTAYCKFFVKGKKNTPLKEHIRKNEKGEWCYSKKVEVRRPSYEFGDFLNSTETRWSC